MPNSLQSGWVNPRTPVPGERAIQTQRGPSRSAGLNDVFGLFVNAGCHVLFVIDGMN